MENELNKIAKALVAAGKGILAADESTKTVEKRFAKINLQSTEENRQAYRELLFTTPKLERYISGIIMFDETIHQSTKDGKSFVQILKDKGIIPGIKVDEGLEDYAGHDGEKVTKGLHGLSIRLKEYRRLGAKFTKWRAAFSIGVNLPSDECIDENAKRLAEFAKMSQQAGLMPIVEPEVLMEGNHSIEESEIATRRVLKKVFEELLLNKVIFSDILLKPNWIHPGLNSGNEPDSKEVAKVTLKVLKEVVPDSVPGLVFLSGGDHPKDATKNLEALNEVGTTPWHLSFSFGRALQEPVLWHGMARGRMLRLRRKLSWSVLNETV